MSPPQPQPPRQQPITSSHVTADLFLSALSILFLFSSSSTAASLSRFPKIPFLPFPLKPRRFSKLPISMSTPKYRHPNNHHPFPTPESLSDWLKPRLPSDSLSSWGVKPGTKNVHNLWLELSEGETLLTDSAPPVRTVNVVTVRVVKDSSGLILVESHQELSDGIVRDRFRPLSEKMKPGETPDEAVFRAVREELGSVLGGDGGVRIVPGTYKEKVEERYSVSYPGLPACYVLHSVDVVVEGLPEGEFVTDEVEEYRDSEERRKASARAVSVRRHFWRWVSPHSVKS